jgi:hypothetical protein
MAFLDDNLDVYEDQPYTWLWLAVAYQLLTATALMLFVPWSVAVRVSILCVCTLLNMVGLVNILQVNVVSTLAILTFSVPALQMALFFSTVHSPTEKSFQDVFLSFLWWSAGILSYILMPLTNGYPLLTWFTFTPLTLLLSLIVKPAWHIWIHVLACTFASFLLMFVYLAFAQWDVWILGGLLTVSVGLHSFLGSFCPAMVPTALLGVFYWGVCAYFGNALARFILLYSALVVCFHTVGLVVYVFYTRPPLYTEKPTDIESCKEIDNDHSSPRVSQ